MGRIAAQWAATFAWVCLMPLLLLDADRDGAALTYVFAGLATIGIAAVPALRRAPLHHSLLPLLALFFLARAGQAMAFGDEPAPWLLELPYLVGAFVLAARLGRTLESADAALETIGIGWESERVAPFEETQGEIYREIRRARRYERPVSLVALSVASGDGEHDSDALMRELQEALAQRYADGQLAKLLLEETDAAALITRWNSHFVVLLPEVDSVRARHLVLRLGNTVAARWKRRLCAGTASFPDQEVTFEGLLARAESELEAQRRAAVQGRPLADSERAKHAQPPHLVSPAGNSDPVSGWPEG